MCIADASCRIAIGKTPLRPVLNPFRRRFICDRPRHLVRQRHVDDSPMCRQTHSRLGLAVDPSFYPYLRPIHPGGFSDPVRRLPFRCARRQFSCIRSRTLFCGLFRACLLFGRHKTFQVAEHGRNLGALRATPIRLFESGSCFLCHIVWLVNAGLLGPGQSATPLRSHYGRCGRRSCGGSASTPTGYRQTPLPKFALSYPE